jgi:putative DNA primase/helicase
MALMQHTPLKERTRGRWHGILTALGIEPKYLTGKHGPCPMCAGEDRWRFTDMDGGGSWICNQCGRGSSGVGLVMQFLGLPFKDAAQRIEAVLGDGVEIRLSRTSQTPAQTRARLNALWDRGAPVRRGDPVDLWLRHRGIELDIYPPCLRTAPSIVYNDDGRGTSRHPGMLARVTGPDGKPVTIHRTYLTLDGRKAAVERPRKAASPIGKSPTIRLAPPGPILGVAEGIETALSAARLFGIPTWSVIYTGGIETFEPPPAVTRVVIFGDNDQNFVGQRAAHVLAARLSSRLSLEVQIPNEPGTDWNDVLLARRNAV